MKVKNNLVCRVLIKEAKEILFQYIMDDISFITAHNMLINIGINLTENNELVDY